MSTDYDFETVVFVCDACTKHIVENKRCILATASAEQPGAPEICIWQVILPRDNEPIKTNWREMK